VKDVINAIFRLPIMKANERQLLFSFTGAMVSTVVLYLLFSWWAPLLVWLSLSVWVTALFCYPIMYAERKVSFINYATRIALSLLLLCFLIYLSKKFHIIGER
jgi:O-antigen/teichoic acid export membrane protein